MIPFQIEYPQKQKQKKTLIQIDDLEENFDIFKERILEKLKISKQKMNIFEYNIKGFDNQLTNVDNIDDFYFILQEFTSFDGYIYIALHNPNLDKEIEIEETKKTERRIQTFKQQVQFTENGEIIQQTCKKFELNFPSDRMYIESKEEICCFCKIGSKDKNAIQEAGPLFGPFTYKRKKYFVHLMCGIWTPNVYLDPKTNKFKELKNEIKRSNKILCSHCSIRGGGLGCKVDKCKQSYHYICAKKKESGCFLNSGNHCLYCPDHQEQFEREINEQAQQEEGDEYDENGNSIMQTSMSNIDNTDNNNNNEKKKNYDDTYCEICRNVEEGNKNDDKIILCDDCDCGYHIYCLDPPLEEIPKDDEWYCRSCLDKFVIKQNINIKNI